ncbi:hypothetical protein LOD99_9061 [Oopsacas minuta]|uniref:Transposase Tc1-like domain-containing protein n=1 Tax=Oopsacas minuta TaxID=111878 RepID=A0AAV7JDW6_9METZ|nr:hypothetical protein LOD99_9061 [Oopsacas minuta]
MFRTEGFLSKIGRIIIPKSLTKKHQSTRKLSRKLKSKGIIASHMTVQRYLKNSNGQLVIKSASAKIIRKQIKDRISFCKQRVNWAVQDWRMVLFSDESLYELFHTPNKQNDRVWAREEESVTPH